MSSVEEWLETGPDYQKAKRSAFLISFVALALAFSAKKGPNQATIKILDVELTHPLVSILAVVILALAYCAYSYHIQQKRASIEHCALVKSYGDITLQEALSKLKAELADMTGLVENAKTAINQARSWAGYDGKIHNIEQIEKIISDTSSVFSADVASNVVMAVSRRSTGEHTSIAPGHLEDDLRALVLTLAKNHAKNLDYHLPPTINHIIGNQVSEINYRAQTGIDQMQRVTEDIVPKVQSKIDALQTGLSHLSDSIEPRERKFFTVETWVTRMTLLAALLAAAGRIAYDVFPGLRQFSLGMWAACVA